MRWVGCIFRTQLRRDKQINGTHYNGTNTKSREAKRQKAGKKSHDATYMVRRSAYSCRILRRVRGVRWVGCIFRTQLRRDKQINGTHYNGTNTKSRKAKRRKATHKKHDRKLFYTAKANCNNNGLVTGRLRATRSAGPAPAPREPDVGVVEDWFRSTRPQNVIGVVRLVPLASVAVVLGHGGVPRA